jgi:two-component system LytT family sensor kinase
MTRHPSAIADPFGRPRRLAVLALALTVPAVIIATQFSVGSRLRGDRFPFAAALVTQLCHWESWALVGPFVWALERRWPLDRHGRRRALFRHAAAAPLIAAAVLFLNLAMYHALIRVPMISGWFAGLDRSFSGTAVIYFVSYFHVELLVYGAIVAAAYASRTTALLRAREHDTLRLEAELTGARLTALRMQLQPHFLFNTLHTIGSLVMQKENERAVQLLTELGELLRGTLAHRDTDLVPLRDELDHLRRYLRIEEARFSDRLRVEWDIDSAAEDVLIPAFILQPLVENAFRHGIARRTDPSVLGIAALTEDGSLRVTVYNDGPLLPGAFAIDGAGGYGLKNVVERLRARRPPGRLQLENAATGVRATLVLPALKTEVRAGA